MRRIIIPIALVLLFSTALYAETVYEVQIHNSTYRASGFGGGPFWADLKPFASNKKGDFLTFCIEDGVSNLSFDKTYYATIDAFAAAGASTDSDGNTKYDLLDNETAALYYKWRTAASQTSFFQQFTNESGNVPTDNKALQQVMWHFEGLTLNSPTTFQKELINYANLLASQKNYLPYVQVLNLWKTKPTHEIDEAYVSSSVGATWVKNNDVQSQLILVPTPSAAFAGLALLGGLLMRRARFIA